jgi:hypothetical protein
MRNEDVFGSPSARTITGRRKNVGSGARVLVRIEPAAGERGIPCLVRPAIQGIDLVEWATGQAQWIAELLLQHRALLFRGFDLDITRFGAFVRRTSGELLEYRDRSTPRRIARRASIPRPSIRRAKGFSPTTRGPTGLPGRCGFISIVTNWPSAGARHRSPTFEAC